MVEHIAEEMESIKAEHDLCFKTIPYQDRVLIRLDQAEKPKHASGLIEVEESQRTNKKYSKEALPGTVVRVGTRVETIKEGDRVYLDRKCWVPTARFVFAREGDVLALGEEEEP